jgi:ATP-dependent Clp protease ATP-binding subunit ClpC
MFARYSERARRALFFTRYELSALGGNLIEPAHVLRGLLHDKGIGRVLANWKMSPAELRQLIEPHARGGTRIPSSIEVGFSPPVQRVLNLAVEEADRLLSNYIEPEHLLVALLREDDPVAAARLREYGMTLDSTREYLVSQLRIPPREPDIEPARSVNPQAIVHLERIRQLVAELAQAEANSAEARALVNRIEEELMMLMDWGLGGMTAEA